MVSIRGRFVSRLEEINVIKRNCILKFVILNNIVRRLCSLTRFYIVTINAIVVLFISSFKSTGVKFTKSGIPIPVDSFGNEMCLLFIKYGRCRFKKKCSKSHWMPPLPGKAADLTNPRETTDFLQIS